MAKLLAKVKFHEGFIKALKDIRNFPDLHLYCSHWSTTLDEDGTILCEVVDDVDINGNPKKALDIELALFDYFFNVSCAEEEQEREKLWKLVDNKITRIIITVVTI